MKTNFNLDCLAKVVGTDLEGLVVGTSWNLEDSQTSVTLEFEDGKTIIYSDPDNELINCGPFEIPIQLYNWRITPSPYGQGLALLLDRGIPCACNTQVVNCHSDNCLSYWTVRKVVKKMTPGLKKQIDSFCDFIRCFDDWTFKELIGVQFCYHLISNVVKECEKNDL
jgi:hypothetical protein